MCEKGAYGTCGRVRDRYGFLVLERSAFVPALEFLGKDSVGWDMSIIFVYGC